MRLTGKKLLLVSNVAETSDSEDLDSYADSSSALRAADALLNFGIIAPMGLLGMWLTRRRWRELWVLYAMAAVYVMSVATFFVFGRFRHPLVPLLVLFAGAALSGLPAWWRRSRAGDRAIGGTLLASAFVMCNWPIVSERSMRASTQYNLGVALMAQGRAEEAIPRFQSAIGFWPDHAPAHSNLAALRLAQGGTDEALRLAQEAVRLDASVAESQNNLGLALAAIGRQDEAIAAFQRAVDLDPGNASMQGNLGTALAIAGRPTEAIVHLGEAVRIDPADAAKHNNLGIALASSGRFEEAVAHFRTALSIRPDFDEAKANLERADALATDAR